MNEEASNEMVICMKEFIPWVGTSAFVPLPCSHRAATASTRGGGPRFGRWWAQAGARCAGVAAHRRLVVVALSWRPALPARPPPRLGLEKKLEAREPARARGGSARLEPAREPHASRAEPISLARKNSEPSRASSVRLASRLASSAQHGSSRPRRQILPYSLPPTIGTESWSQGRRRYASCHV